MAKRRAIKLDQFNISSDAFWELYYFCRQYSEKKLKVSGGSAYSDVCLIELTVKEAGPDIFPYLLQAVAKGESYLELKMMHDIPCGKNYFNKRRRKFYYLLAQRKGLIIINNDSGKLDDIIKQLEDLIADRKSFILDDSEYNDVFLKDVESLRLAVGIIALVKTLRPQN